MKKQDKKRLRELRTHLSTASAIADELSHKVKGFAESKPLNILYKEILNLDYAVNVMLGDMKLNKKELKYLQRVPDCLKIFINLKKEE